MKYEIFRGLNGEWFWRLRAKNGEIIGGGGESYTRKHDVKRAIRLFRWQALFASVEHGFAAIFGCHPRYVGDTLGDGKMVVHTRLKIHLRIRLV